MYSNIYLYIIIKMTNNNNAGLWNLRVLLHGKQQEKGLPLPQL